MTEKTRSVTRRRRRRAVLVPLLTVGVAVWAVRRRLSESHGPDTGWHTLPPAPHPRRAAGPTPFVAARPDVTEPAVNEPVAAEPVPTPPIPGLPVPGTAGPAARARAVPTTTTLASVAAPAGPAVPGALPALADGSSPDPAYTVKGKVATKVFHVPGGAYYTRTRADVWFRSAPAARAAGFTERVRRHV